MGHSRDVGDDFLADDGVLAVLAHLMHQLLRLLSAVELQVSASFGVGVSGFGF